MQGRYVTGRILSDALTFVLEAASSVHLTLLGCRKDVRAALDLAQASFVRGPQSEHIVRPQHIEVARCKQRVSGRIGLWAGCPWVGQLKRASCLRWCLNGRDAERCLIPRLSCYQLTALVPGVTPNL